MKTPLRFLPLMFALAAPLPAADAPVPLRERLSFDAGWRFTRGDSPGVGESLAYERVREWLLPTGDHLLNYRPARADRPGAGGPGRPDFAQPGCNDSTWRQLDLPHDWGIEGPFSQELSGDTGKLPWFGTAWYRKHFQVPASDAGRRLYLEVDGAMAYSMVWCNGEFVGGWPYGYSSWRVDLTPHLKPGADNVIAIRLDNPRESSRWYPGGGLYRHVWLLKTNPVAVAQWGVFVTTPTVTTERATVDVGVTLDNATATRADVQLGLRIRAADENGEATGPAVVEAPAVGLRMEAGRPAHASFTVKIDRPKLWSLKERNRYVAEVFVANGGAGRIVDFVGTPFGIRTVEHTANDGFRLNGERVPLNGVCDHHDLGALGSAINFRALQRQLEILQGMGCNAIRTSHNPPAPELLELCDRMGFLVMDEAFDCWRLGKKRDDYSRLFDDWHEKDLRALVRRDRNHPCVIQWSIGNEVREQGEPDGWKLAAHLAAIVREEDRTRVVVTGMNHIESAYNGFQAAVDVVGYNYKPDEYANVRARHPQIPLMGAETASTISTRGEYFFPVSEDKLQGQSDFQMSSYDLYAPPWAKRPDWEWRALDELPYVMGEFVWTGFDYIGEPTPYNEDATNLLNYADPTARERAAKELAALGRIRVPSRSSYFGIVDLAGFPKDRYYLYQARWRPDVAMVHVLPHWNWPERVGQVTPVFAYSSGDEAELFVNGKSQGRRVRGPFEYRFRWDEVVYEPGEIRVVAYKRGQKWAEETRRTTGPASQLTLKADRSSIRADGADLSYVTVTVADRDGQMVPRSHPSIRFSIAGPGEIVATDNGDPTSFESFQSPQRKAFNGLALVIVRAAKGQSGAFTLRAESEGLASAELKLQAN